MDLPPGQRKAREFPRFGPTLLRPPPEASVDSSIVIDGVVTRSCALPVAQLASLPRCRVTTDLHCVAGWSAVSHVVFVGSDGYRSVARLEDVLADDVLIANQLHGCPLDGAHGAPARLVSPHQCGYVSTKHLQRIEVGTSEPQVNGRHERVLARLVARSPLFEVHPRARVWREERVRRLPAFVMRPICRLPTPPIMWLGGLAQRRSDAP